GRRHEERAVERRRGERDLNGGLAVDRGRGPLRRGDGERQGGDDVLRTEQPHDAGDVLVLRRGGLHPLAGALGGGGVGLVRREDPLVEGGVALVVQVGADDAGLQVPVRPVALDLHVAAGHGGVHSGPVDGAGEVDRGGVAERGDRLGDDVGGGEGGHAV